MPNRPKISVIIPCYNTAEYLPRCLDSVLHNTYSNIEIICVNDGSTDETLSVLNHYKDMDSRIIVIDQKNAGVSAARNVGIAQSIGTFISFIDSDDWIHPQYFETLLAVQEQTGADITVCEYQSVHAWQPDYSPVLLSFLSLHTLSSMEALQNNYLKRLVWGRLYRTSAIANVYFERGLSWGEDTLFNIHLYTRDLQITLIYLELYYYFQRETSVTQTLLTSDKLSLLDTYLSYCDSAENNLQLHLYLTEFIKQLLSLRYIEMFDMTPAESNMCQELINQCKARMKACKVLTIKEKLIYHTFLCFPSLYRLFRILDDPTLLQWEKDKKNKKAMK